MKKFKLRDRKSKKYFTVIVYNTLKELRAAAIKHDRVTGMTYDPTNNDILGIVNSYERFKIMPDGREVISDEIGTVRLSKTHLHNDIVFHELVHAAMKQYKVEHKNKANFDNMEREEELAHIYDRLARAMVHQLYKHKFWS